VLGRELLAELTEPVALLAAHPPHTTRRPVRSG
jgi:hypothetical protein